LDAALLSIAVIGSVIALAMPDARAERTAGFLRRTALVPLLALQQRAEGARRAIVAHDSLTFVADSVAMRAHDAGRLADENEQLRAMLDLGRRLPWNYIATDALHGPQPGEPHTIVLRAGTRAGVAPFSPVITPQGIVGYVRSADEATSVAIVWPHPDFRVSAVSVDGGAFGIVAPYQESGASHFMLELRGVPFRSPLDSGTQIVSSGFGGTFPRGVPIGTILRALADSSGWERSYLVVPAVRPVQVGTVLVLTSRGSPNDLSALWAPRDSAGDGQ
jgi:rod shape-determining protein MreC